MADRGGKKKKSQIWSWLLSQFSSFHLALHRVLQLTRQKDLIITFFTANCSEERIKKDPNTSKLYK